MTGNMEERIWRHVPCVQVISEPGVDAALDGEWEDKVVFAEGVANIAEQLRLYRCSSGVPLLLACVRVPSFHDP